MVPNRLQRLLVDLWRDTTRVVLGECVVMALLLIGDAFRSLALK
jgi:hypothetical protein